MRRVVRLYLRRVFVGRSVSTIRTLLYQEAPGLLAHSGVKYSTLRSIAVDMIIVFVDQSVLLAYE